MITQWKQRTKLLLSIDIMIQNQYSLYLLNIGLFIYGNRLCHQLYNLTVDDLRYCNSIYLSS